MSVLYCEHQGMHTLFLNIACILFTLFSPCWLSHMSSIGCCLSAACVWQAESDCNPTLQSVPRDRWVEVSQEAESSFMPHPLQFSLMLKLKRSSQPFWLLRSLVPEAELSSSQSDVTMRPSDSSDFGPCSYSTPLTHSFLSTSDALRSCLQFWEGRDLCGAQWHGRWLAVGIFPVHWSGWHCQPRTCARTGGFDTVRIPPPAAISVSTCPMSSSRMAMWILWRLMTGIMVISPGRKQLRSWPKVGVILNLAPSEWFHVNTFCLCSGTWKLARASQRHHSGRLLALLLLQWADQTFQNPKAWGQVLHGWTLLWEASFHDLWNFGANLSYWWFCGGSIAEIVERYKKEQIVEGYILETAVLRVSVAGPFKREHSEELHVFSRCIWFQPRTSMLSDDPNLLNRNGRDIYATMRQSSGSNFFLNRKDHIVIKGFLNKKSESSAPPKLKSGCLDCYHETMILISSPTWAQVSSCWRSESSSVLWMPIHDLPHCAHGCFFFFSLSFNFLHIRGVLIKFCVLRCLYEYSLSWVVGLLPVGTFRNLLPWDEDVLCCDVTSSS